MKLSGGLGEHDVSHGTYRATIQLLLFITRTQDHRPSPCLWLSPRNWIRINSVATSVISNFSPEIYETFFFPSCNTSGKVENATTRSTNRRHCNYLYNIDPLMIGLIRRALHFRCNHQNNRPMVVSSRFHLACERYSPARRIARPIFTAPFYNCLSGRNSATTDNN